MVIGTNNPTTLANFKENAARVIAQTQQTVPNLSLLKQVFQTTLQKGNVRQITPQPGALVFTDDKAPVEEVIDQIILGVVNESGK